jgi:hypothetical protein
MERAEVPYGVALLGRAGYVARGIVHVIVGGLAVLAALGRAEGATTDSKGALLTVFNQPLGTALLGALAVGLAGYALWRGLDAVLDPDRRGCDVRGLCVRGAHVGSAIAHAALAVFAVRLLLGDGPSGGGELPREATGSAFQLPFGRWLVLGAGAATVGVGLVHGVRGALGRYERRLKQRPGPWLCRLGRFGHVARGVVIAIIGGFLITAAVRFHSREARGLEGALDALREQPFGPWLLLATALGLTAFGVWSFVEARLRHMPAKPPGPRARELADAVR